MNAQLQPATQNPSPLPPQWQGRRITLAHGAGGAAMRALITELILPAFGNRWLAPLEDQARIAGGELAAGESLAFTTDSYVVTPLEFPGADIGRLAVCGTVNDLAVGGARPRWLSCGLILEEGLQVETLARVLESMSAAACEAGVAIVTGDTKVVGRGAADGLYINTAGIGSLPQARSTGPHAVRPGDLLVINGSLGDHGIAVMAARNDLALEIPVRSDCAPLNGLIETMFAAAPGLRWLRDLTRGGLAGVANEFATEGRFGLILEDTAIPVSDPVRGACELLGLDPLYLANEGKLAALVAPDESEALLTAMRGHPYGRQAAVVGRVCDGPAGRVRLRSAFGGERVVDVLEGEQLPRIC